MKLLCTFSGQYGDILWSLPTVRALAKLYDAKAHFGTMKQFESIVPLLKAQDYIEDAFVINGWEETGRPFGVQPWQPPINESEWGQVYHLTYHESPVGSSDCLPVFIGKSAGVTDLRLNEPFITIPAMEKVIDFHNVKGNFATSKHYVTLGFNQSFPHETDAFIQYLVDAHPDLMFVDTTKLPWLLAAAIMEASLGFIGCRSSNHVLAHGLGKKCIIYELQPWRNNSPFVFSFGKELTTQWAHEAIAEIQKWKEEENELDISNAR